MAKDPWAGDESAAQYQRVILKFCNSLCVCVRSFKGSVPSLDVWSSSVHLVVLFSLIFPFYRGQGKKGGEDQSMSEVYQ